MAQQATVLFSHAGAKGSWLQEYCDVILFEIKQSDPVGDAWVVTTNEPAKEPDPLRFDFVRNQGPSRRFEYRFIEDSDNGQKARFRQRLRQFLAEHWPATRD